MIQKEGRKKGGREGGKGRAFLTNSTNASLGALWKRKCLLRRLVEEEILFTHTRSKREDGVAREEEEGKQFLLS